MKTIIHINQHVIKQNKKYDMDQPPITVKTYKSNQYASQVKINGPCEVVYQPSKPLSCGAQVWIETDSKYVIVN